MPLPRRVKERKKKGRSKEKYSYFLIFMRRKLETDLSAFSVSPFRKFDKSEDRHGRGILPPASVLRKNFRIDGSLFFMYNNYKQEEKI